MDKRKKRKATGAKKGASKAGTPPVGGADEQLKLAAPEAVAPKDLDVPPRETLIPGLIEPADSQFAAGPGKEPRKGAPQPRLGNHKERSKWFQARSAWPLREAPTPTMINERSAVTKSLPPAPGTAQWEMAGPTNIGGRTTSIVCHPTKPERIWIGAAGGGVWFSPDGGQTWQSQWHHEDVLNVGSLAIDPVNPDIIYCGTGEANLSADSYAGVGIYRTLDGGLSWHLFAPAVKTGLPVRIGVIAIDPFNRQHIRIGGVGFSGMGGAGNDLGGMYASLDGGITWRREQFISTKNYWCHSIVFDPKNKGTIYTTFTDRGFRNGIYKSTNGGTTWTQLTGGLPPSAQIGRTSLAISRSNPKVLYAFATDEAGNSSDLLLGVFRTANGGKTWTNVAGSEFKNERQIGYGNTIAVHPKNSNHVICGGVDLHLTKDGGKNWKQVTFWDQQRGLPDYAHADQHALLMPEAKPGRVYACNDGGMDLSEDGGLNWVNRSNGLAITMYYDLDIAQSDARRYGGGAQDNGTLITLSGSSSDHFELLGGDGGWVVIDPKDAGHIFASAQHFFMFRFRGGTNKNVSPPADENEQNFVWMCYIAMDPNNSKTVFTGSYRVWRTKTDGDTWTPVSPALDRSSITAIEIAPANSQRVYVGTENGGFFRSLDGGNTWSPNLTGSTLPGHSITRLITSPADANLVYATFANFNHSHVFRSRDGGLNWDDVDKGQLPDVTHHSIVIPRDSPDTIYVCNDVGVYVSTDAAATWKNLTRNLPNVMVVDLAYHVKNRTLSAATYGRSIWRIKV